jgi:hypothetical protein
MGSASRSEIRIRRQTTTRPSLQPLEGESERARRSYGDEKTNSKDRSSTGTSTKEAQHQHKSLALDALGDLLTLKSEKWPHYANRLCAKKQPTLRRGSCNPLQDLECGAPGGIDVRQRAHLRCPTGCLTKSDRKKRSHAKI